MDSGDTLPEQKEPIASPEKTPKSIQSKLWREIVEWIQVIAIALVIALPIRYFIAEPFIVEGASMDPTFATGQFLIVDRLSYRMESPKRGDVIVFTYPINESQDFIKRIVGLPNEKLEMKDGAITIYNEANPKGLKLVEPYIDPVHASHDILSVTLKSDEYFVMGDNRAQSSDSRTWGPLTRHYIIGRPLVRLLPVTSLSIFPGESRNNK